VTIVYRTLKLNRYVAAIVLLPVLWALGNLVPNLSYQVLALRGGAMQLGVFEQIAVLQATALVTALVVGVVVACIARALGHEAIRTLLSPSQAQLFGLLATSVLWIAFTGLNWASFRQDELLAIVWTIISGAAFALYGAVWLMLAVRAAASLHPLQTAVTLVASAEASFLSALGGALLLLIYLDRSPTEPSLLLFGLVLLLNVALVMVPPALAVAAGSALWSAILTSRERPEAHGSGDNTATD
jgi:hypothetical protein